MMARARGSGSRILKRTSHIRIVLTDEVKIENREQRKTRLKAEAKAAKQEGQPSEGKAHHKPKAAKKSAKSKAKK